MIKTPIINHRIHHNISVNESIEKVKQEIKLDNSATLYIVTPNCKKANFESPDICLCLINNLLITNCMISLILHHDPIVRDAFVRVLSLEKKIQDESGNTLYQRGKWLFVSLAKPIAEIEITDLIANYQPDNIYLPSFGTSIDLVHEETDIVLPNVFLTYNTAIEAIEFGEQNRDNFLGQAEFLEIYNEQKDYYVEDF